MRELTNAELTKVKGGGLSIATITMISIGVSFVIGLIDGYFRPLKCR